MEAKKNPSKDIHRKSGMFFLIGLSVNISIVVCAFEWTTLKPELYDRTQPNDLAMAIVDPTIFIVEPTVKAPAVSPVKKIIPPEAITATTEPQPEAKEPILISPIPSPLTFPEPEIQPMEREESDTIHVNAEKMPEPVGGYAAFYRSLGDKMKYPKRALNARIQGRVFLEFIVNKKGELQQMKAIRGIGFGCDDEALRLLALTKWNPGKQRGTPVNVKMVLPFQFRLD